MKTFIILFLFLFCVSDLESANILVIIPSPFFSHQATYRPLWRELAKNGHQITLFTTDLMEHNENITQIDCSHVYNLFAKKQMMEIFQGISVKTLKNLKKSFDKFMDYYLAHPSLIELIKTKKKFDLFFVEIMIPVFPVLSKVFDCPFIGLNTMDAVPSVHAQLGNAMHPSIYPYADFGYGTKLTFYERLMSFTFLISMYGPIGMMARSYGNGYAAKYLGPNLPDIIDVQKNVSLILTNANPILFPTRPITPTTINLGGGLHIQPPKKLPQDIQEYLDNAKSGCIFFSFGTTVNSEFLNPETIEIFRKTFEDLAPIKILWKYDDTLNNVPKNLKIKKWFPQQDVLRHKNVRVFITHGGLQSMEESIHSAVPMLGIPFYGDQNNNVRKMSEKKFGISLDIKTMNQTILKNSILELFNNPMYKKNVEKYSKVLKDRPMTPLEEAVWWSEYVLRHGGTEHLKSPSADIPLYQYYFLDILAFLILIVSLFILFIYFNIKIFLILLRKCFKKNKTKKE